MNRTLDTNYDRDPMGSLTPWHKPEHDKPKPDATVRNAYADLFDENIDISENAAIKWNLEERQRLAAEAQAAEEEAARYPILAIEDSWTPDQIKAIVLADERQQHDRDLDARAEFIGSRFASEEPRYIPNAANARRIMEWADARYGDTANVDDLPEILHEAFNDLVAKGEMQTNKLRPAPRRKYTAEELDNLPIEQLRELSNDNARFTLEPEVPRYVINPNRSRV